MTENAREHITGKDPNLPPFIVDRMIGLGMRPTLRQLAEGAGVPKNTLGPNLHGQKAMKLETAVKLAEFLQLDLTELVVGASLC